MAGFALVETIDQLLYPAEKEPTTQRSAVTRVYASDADEDEGEEGAREACRTKEQYRHE